MAGSIKIVKVFIASPGGLDDERQAARRVVDEINRSHSEHWGCEIKLVGWEYTISGYSRAQSLINQELDTCDYFVGMVWNHWGSKPDQVVGQYSSGFEEEFERAKARIEARQMRDLALFFKKIPDIQRMDQGPSVKQVIAFREKCIAQKKPLFQEFDKTGDFEPIFRATIENIGWQECLIPSKRSDALENEQPKSKPEEETKNLTSTSFLIDPKASEFLKSLSQRSDGWDLTFSYEVARLRLIGTSIYRSGNNQLHLGGHDANLLFLNRNKFVLSVQEISTLIDAGVSSFENQNMPIWYWISKLAKPGTYYDQLEMLSVFGNAEEKPNAIAILQRAKRQTPQFGDTVDRKFVLNDWLTSDGDIKVFEAAIEFLKTNGTQDDLPIIETLISKAISQRRPALEGCIIGILTRGDKANAIAKLIAFDPDPIDDEIIRNVFSDLASISSETLTACLFLKSRTARKLSTVELFSRKAIATGVAERLMADDDSEIRLIAIKSLSKNGVVLAEEAIKGALIVQKNRTHGLFGFGIATETDDSSYTQYLRDQLAEFSYSELESRCNASSVFDHLALSVRYTRFTAKSRAEIIQHLANGFKDFTESKIQDMIRVYGTSSKLVEDARDLETFLSARMTNFAFEALCVHARREDLAAIRKGIEREEVKFSKYAMQFIARYGDWSDHDRILKSYGRVRQRRNSLFEKTDYGHESLAHALYSIGRLRLVDLLSLDLDMEVKQAIYLQMGRQDILRLAKDFLSKELRRPETEVRKVVALKCIQAMPRSGITKMLRAYTADMEGLFYNVVHWLDLGASMPREEVQTISKFELESFK